MLINENKKNAMVIFLGYMPLFSVYVNDRVSKGIFTNAHAWMMNMNAIREVNKMQITKSCQPDNINGIYKKFLKIKFYAIKPNNLFFQLSDKNSEVGKLLGDKIWFRIQKLVTKRMYYQYDPIFAKYYNPIIEGISTSLKLFIYLYMINYISAKI